MTQRVLMASSIAMVLALIFWPLFYISCDGWFAYDPFCWWSWG